LIEKLLDPSINLSPNPLKNADGSIKLPGLDNHAMGTIFEELVRRFNEENNEEAGEHWTPRDVVKLMARLIFMPIADQIESGTYLLRRRLRHRRHAHGRRRNIEAVGR
jgi:type I restriction enzyme M protein